jgi:hypothetical protein
VFAGSLDELCSPCTSALLADTFKLGTLHLMRGVGHISGMMEGWQVSWHLYLHVICSEMRLHSCAFRKLLFSLLDPNCPFQSTDLCCPFRGFNLLLCVSLNLFAKFCSDYFFLIKSARPDNVQAVTGDDSSLLWIEYHGKVP